GSGKNEGLGFREGSSLEPVREAAALPDEDVAREPRRHGARQIDVVGAWDPGRDGAVDVGPLDAAAGAPDDLLDEAGPVPELVEQHRLAAGLEDERDRAASAVKR